MQRIYSALIAAKVRTDLNLASSICFAVTKFRSKQANRNRCRVLSYLCAKLFSSTVGEAYLKVFTPDPS